MIPLPPRQMFWHLFPLLLLVACSGRASPTPRPTMTATPAIALPTPTNVASRPLSRPLSQPTSTATPAPAQGTAELAPFAIPLPTNWGYRGGGERLQRASVAKLADQQPTLFAWLQSAAHAEASSWLVAWPQLDPGLHRDPDDATVGEASHSTVTPGLIGQVLPRRDLTIARYLAAMPRALEAQPNVTLHEARFDYTLRTTHPVGYLHYTTAFSTTQLLATDAITATVAGYQLLFFDEPATSLLVLTFITPTVAAPAPVALSTASTRATATTQLPAEFAAIVRAIHPITSAVSSHSPLVTAAPAR